MLSTNFIGKQLSSCIMNASGALCTTETELVNLNVSSAGLIVSKSCSLAPRIGNPKPRYYHNENLSINSMGLPNNGFEFYMGLSFEKPYILSIAVMDIPDTLCMLEKALQSENIFAIELNVSCPNVVNKNTVMAYHPDKLEEFLIAMINILKNPHKPIGLKLSPYWEAQQFIDISELIMKYKIDFITTINSVPNCLVLDTETESPVIAPKNGIGGLGGIGIKPIVLSNVYQFSKLINVPIIGCGGVDTGDDVFQLILAGASLVQVGTTLMMEGTGVFHRLEHELQELMHRKGYTNIEDFRGKIKNNVNNNSDY